MSMIPQNICDLRSLIKPITTENFTKKYWERIPLLVQRNNPNYFGNLLSLADVDHILSTSSLRSPDVRLYKDGEEVPITTLSQLHAGESLESLYREYRRGSTIVINSIHRRWEPLLSLSQSLASEFSAYFAVNAYLTPGNAKGFSAHYDTHDVFVLQVEGSKQWRLYENQVRLPLRRELNVVQRILNKKGIERI